MHLTMSSILNVTFLSGIAVVILYFLLKKQNIINHLTFRILFLCLAMILIRMILPVECRFATTIPDWYILPYIRDFLTFDITTAYGYDIQIIHILYMIWILGSIISAVKTIFEFITLKKLIRNGNAVEADLQDCFKLVLQKYKRKKEFRLIQVKTIDTPMIFGIRKPYILLPDITLSKEQWTYILKHEIAHYYHGDLWTKYFLALFTIIYWWNPFAYILNKQVSKILELHTDKMVIQDLKEEQQLDYAACLLHMSKQQLTKAKKNNNFAISFIGSKNFSLSQRFHFITASEQQRKRKFSTSFVLLPILAITLFSFCFIFEPCSRDAEDIGESVLLTPENAYLVPNSESGYDIYYNGEYFGPVSTTDIGVTLPVYDNKNDIP